MSHQKRRLGTDRAVPDPWAATYATPSGAPERIEGCPHGAGWGPCDQCASEALSLYLKDGPHDLVHFGSWQQDALETAGLLYSEIQAKLRLLGDLIQRSGEAEAHEVLDAVAGDFEVLGMLLQARMLQRGIPLKRKEGQG
jgi:hypothetical protein